MNKPKVLIIYTGGTIGMFKAHADAPLRPFDFDHLMNNIPEMLHLDCEVDTTTTGDPIDSTDMNIERWVQLAKLIGDHYEQYDGFVVLHGSDTMAFTASALSFLLENLSKPVIFTGSQLPIGITRTDAKENLLTSIEMAAARNIDGSAMVPEVAIYFEYKLYRGNRTHKFNSEHFKAFRSPNFPLLAEAGVHLKFHNEYILPASSEPLVVHNRLTSEIATLKLFPGMDGEIYKPLLENPRLQGLIIETYGSGNAPNRTWLHQSIERLIKRGVPVVNISQCVSGSVIHGKYENSSWLEQLGVISGKDMIYEAATAKMRYLLSKKEEGHSFETYFQENLRGEISP